MIDIVVKNLSWQRYYVPRMHGKGCWFYFGNLGVERCSLDAAFVLPSELVRDDCAPAVPMGSAAKAVTFGGFPRLALGI